MRASVPGAALLLLFAIGCSTPRPEKPGADLYWRIQELESQTRRYQKLRMYVAVAEMETTTRVVGATDPPRSSRSAAAMRRLEHSTTLLASIDQATATLKAELDRVSHFVRAELDAKVLEALEAKEKPNGVPPRLGEIQP